MFRVIVLIILTFLPSGALASGKEALAGKNFAVEAVAGVPQMFGLQLSFVGLPRLRAGFSFGSAPVDALLRSSIRMERQPLNLTGSTDVYYLLPSASYTLTSTTGFIRWIPWGEGWFAQINYASWAFRGNLSGALQNETQGTTVAGVGSGSINLIQPMLGLTLGYELALDSGLFFSFGLGVEYLLRTQATVSLGGSATAYLPLLPDADQAFSDAQTNAQAQVDQAVRTLQQTVSVIPGLFFTVGYAF